MTLTAMLVCVHTVLGFTATFSNVRGNNWWVETNVTADGTIAGVDARANGGTWVPLSATTWGSWARSLSTSTSGTFEFRARSNNNELSMSGAYSWPSGTPVNNPPPVNNPSFTATFNNPRGNNWWIEVNVSSNGTLAGVDARVSGGAWQALNSTTWGSWARSIFAATGSSVEFRARGSSGGTAQSRAYNWPNATPVTPVQDCRVAGCGSGQICCQTSALNNVTSAERTFACLAPASPGVCPAPDLTVDQSALSNNYIQTLNFSASSCAVEEQCVSGTGARRLLRFATVSNNIGQRDLSMGNPINRPDLFTYAPCHNHYHFRDYATYRLLSANGQVLATGRKQSFCLEDTLHFAGPRNSPQFNCQNQGISAGWGDEYGPSLDCQWIDITGIPSGQYTLEVEVNSAHVLYETNYSNNASRIPVSF